MTVHGHISHFQENIDKYKIDGFSIDIFQIYKSCAWDSLDSLNFTGSRLSSDNDDIMWKKAT